MMVSTAVYKKETIEGFKSIEMLANCLGHVTQPRDVSSKYILKKETPAKYFLSVTSNFSVVIDNQKAEELILKLKSLRRKHFWFLWRMYAPSRRVINSAVKVIRFCPSDLFLEGYTVANYGNGTVALMRRSTNYSMTINIGTHAVSYAKLRLADHQIVNSGCCPIERDAIRQLFETL